MIFIWMFLICIVAGLILGFGYILFVRVIGKKKIEKLETFFDEFQNLIIGSIIIIGVVFFVGKSYIGEKGPGSFFERSVYDTKVYVLVFPNSDKTKNYYLPADISKDNENSGYSVNVIHWPNGGTTTFNSCSNVNLNSKTYCPAENSDEGYDIQLTNNKVN